MSGPGYPPGSPPETGYRAPIPGIGMTLGQILERIFWLLRSYPRLLVGLAITPAVVAVVVSAVALAPGVIIMLPFAHSHSGPPPASAFVGVFLPILFSYFAIWPVFALYAAAASHAVVRTNLGYEVTWREAWTAARERLGCYVQLFFLLILIVSGPFYILIVVGAGSLFLFGWGPHGHTALAAILIFAPLFALVLLSASVYSILAVLHVALAFPASVIEGLAPVAAIRRSAALTRGAKGRIFAALLAVYAASAVINLVCMVTFAILAYVAALIGALFHLLLNSAAVLFFIAPLAIVSLSMTVLALIALPYSGYATALGVLYCDQRMREGSISPAMPPAGKHA
jgi:hypothetical protein